MKKWLTDFQKNARGKGISLTASLLCAILAVIFLCWYFGTFERPYMMKGVVDLSEGWRYSTPAAAPQELETLRTGPRLAAGERLTLTRTISEEMEEAALLIRANHQTLKVFLEGEPLYAEPDLQVGQNPGMALHYILLPEEYAGKTLTVELVSPYKLYSGRTSPIFMGTEPSLQAFALSHSMRPLILMSMCLLLGFCTIALSILQAFRGGLQPQNLAIGMFAVIWALYYICTEYVMFTFFSPFWVSTLSLGLYFSFQAPLSLFFYFSFQHYRRWMLPAVCFHCAFPIVAVFLQYFGAASLPELINVNNALLIGLAYTIVLALLEILRKNRQMMLAAPFLALAYISMLYNFEVFYTRSGVVPYSYRDTFFLLILCVLLSSVWQFFRLFYRRQHEAEVLALQNKLARESYEQLTGHLRQVGGLKHEMKNHMEALQICLREGRYDEAKEYLSRYAGNARPVTEAVLHEHYLINALVGDFMQKARQGDVDVELDLRANPGKIDDPDLYSLFSNILENALEAATAESGRRFVRLSVFRRDPYFLIACENSCTGEIRRENGKIVSAKPEEGHGFGLWIIGQIAEKYGGFAQEEEAEGSFSLLVALKDG